MRDGDVGSCDWLVLVEVGVDGVAEWLVSEVGSDNAEVSEIGVVVVVVGVGKDGIGVISGAFGVILS